MIWASGVGILWTLGLSLSLANQLYLGCKMYNQTTEVLHVSLCEQRVRELKVCLEDLKVLLALCAIPIA